MTKDSFNKCMLLITDKLEEEEKLDSLCHFYGITKSELNEFLTDLSLIGFKEKYKQHNHLENNR